MTAAKSEPKTKVRFVIIREGVVQSWAKDGVTFGFLLLTIWFNATFAGDSAWIYAAAALAFVAMGYNRQHQMTADEARLWIDQQFPPEAP